MNGQGVHYAVTNHLHARWALRAYASELAPLFWLVSHLTLVLEFCFALVVIRTLRAIPGPRSELSLAARIVAITAAAVGAFLFADVYAPVAQIGLPPWLWLFIGASVGFVINISIETEPQRT